MELFGEAAALDRRNGIILASVLCAFGACFAEDHLRVLKEVLVNLIDNLLAIDVRDRARVDSRFSELFRLDAIILCTIDVDNLFDLSLILFPWVTLFKGNHVPDLCRGFVRDVFCGKDPIRLLQGGLLPLFQEDNVRYHVRSGVGAESVVGQPDRAEEVCPLGQIAAHRAVLGVQRIA